jgi:hypothetical protein
MTSSRVLRLRNVHEARLPFTVSVASAAQMPAVSQLRASAYGRHLPAMAEVLAQPESADSRFGCEVIVAASKLDGSVLGTLRTHSNVVDPLPLEAAVDIQQAFNGDRLVEATRLCVGHGTSASLVRNALFKAFFLYAEQQNIDWLVAGGRRPVDTIYDRLLFTDILEPGVYYPLPYAANIPHRIMRFNVGQAQELWACQAHPLYEFVFDTFHPDIDLSGARDLSAIDWRQACPTALPGSVAATAHRVRQAAPVRTELLSLGQ